MIAVAPVILEGHGVRLEPLAPEHRDGLAAAASDGRLWELWYTSVPAPEETAGYIDRALAGQLAGDMLPWAVRELASGAIVGSTRYHDIVAAIDRVEIGWTWYAAAWQRSHVNTACKLLLFAHAFEQLGLPGGRPADGQLQLRLAARDRSARREEGRRAPPPLGAARRLRARQRDLQPARRRVAGRPQASRRRAWRATKARQRRLSSR